MSASETSQSRDRRALRPLAGLAPYLGRYRVLVAAAAASLILAAAMTLALPLAVLRLFDHVFSDCYHYSVGILFEMLLGVAAVVAVA